MIHFAKSNKYRASTVNGWAPGSVVEQTLRNATAKFPLGDMMVYIGNVGRKSCFYTVELYDIDSPASLLQYGQLTVASWLTSKSLRFGKMGIPGGNPCCYRANVQSAHQNWYAEDVQQQ